MDRFFLIVNMDKDPDLKITDRLCNYLRLNNKEVCVKKIRPLSDDPSERGVYCSDIPADTDSVIILGGDGSFLHSAVTLASLKIPVAGLNLGTLGYLSQFNQENFEEELEAMFSGNFTTEDRIMLSGELIRDGKVLKNDTALNDIVVRRCDGLSAIRLEVLLNGKPMKNCICDGLIIATPTGSTAYNLSVGGSVIDPLSGVLAVTPIAAHSLSDRSVIVSDESEIEVKLLSIPRNETADVTIGFDGKFMTRMQTGDILKIKKSKDTVKLIKLDKYNFYDVLNKKMRID